MRNVMRALAFLNPGLVRVLSWFAGAAVMSLIGLYLLSTRPPGQLISIKEDGRVAVVGGHFVLLIHTNKQRHCPENRQRWLFHHIRVNGQTLQSWVYIGSIPQPPVPLGQDYYGVELPLPPQADPDDYAYMSHTDYDCGMFHGLLGPPSSESPIVPLSIVSPSGERVVPIKPIGVAASANPTH